MTLDLGREPNLRDRTFAGGRVVRLWEGQRNAAGTALEISEVELDQAITPARLRAAWLVRRGQTVRPVIVAAAHGDGWLVCGPQGTPPPVIELTPELTSRILAQLLDEPPVSASLHALALFARTQGSGSVPGFRNRSLVSTHYVTNVIRRERRPEWTDAAAQGNDALGRAGEGLLRAVEALAAPWPPTVGRSLRAILDREDASAEAKAEQIVQFVAAEGLRPPVVAVERPITREDVHLVCYQVLEA